MKESSKAALNLICMLFIRSNVIGRRWEYKTWVCCSFAQSTSLIVKCKSWMFMNGDNNPMKTRKLRGHNKKDEFPEPVRQEKPSLMAFLAWMMEDQVGESVVWVILKRILGPTGYLLDNRSTQSFEKDWSIYQTSLPKRQILVSLVVQIPKPPWCFERAILFQPTRWISLLLSLSRWNYGRLNYGWFDLCCHTHTLREPSNLHVVRWDGGKWRCKSQSTLSVPTERAKDARVNLPGLFKSMFFQEAKRVCFFSIIKRKSLCLALPLRIGKRM